MSLRLAVQRSRSRRLPTRPPAPSWPRRRPRCPRRWASRATGTTAMRGSATRASAPARLPSSACAGRGRRVPRVHHALCRRARRRSAGRLRSRGERRLEGRRARRARGLPRLLAGPRRQRCVGPAPARRLRRARQPDVALASPRPLARRRRLALSRLADRPRGGAVVASPTAGSGSGPASPTTSSTRRCCAGRRSTAGSRLADECMRRAPTRRWKRARDELREAIERARL